jgi:hypothetical protein
MVQVISELHVTSLMFQGTDRRPVTCNDNNCNLQPATCSAIFGEDFAFTPIGGSCSRSLNAYKSMINGRLYDPLK